MPIPFHLVYLFVAAISLIGAVKFVLSPNVLYPNPIGIVFWALVFIFTYIRFIRRPFRGQDKEIFWTDVAVFNVVILYLFYLSSFELGARPAFLRVSYTFGNFADFLTMPYSYAKGTFEWVQTGYFPLSYVVAKAFAVAVSWGPAGDPEFTILRNAYLLTFLLCCIASLPLLLVIRSKFSLSSHSFFSLLGFALLSYPFFVAFERGNFSIFGFALLSLFAWAYLTGRMRAAAVLLGLAASIKVLNFVFLIFLFSRFSLRYVATGLFTILFSSFLSLIYIFGLELGSWIIFKDALLAPIMSNVVFSDPAKIIATTSLDAFRALIYTLFNGVVGQMTSAYKPFDLAALAAGGSLYLFFYLFSGRRLAWYLEFIFILLIPTVFHPASGDYNVILLYPFFIILFFSAQSEDEFFLLRSFSLVCLLLSGITVGGLTCCGDGLGRSVGVSLRAAIVPVALLFCIGFIIRLTIASRPVRSP